MKNLQKRKDLLLKKLGELKRGELTFLGKCGEKHIMETEFAPQQFFTAQGCPCHQNVVLFLLVGIGKGCKEHSDIDVVWVLGEENSGIGYWVGTSLEDLEKEVLDFTLV